MEKLFLKRTKGTNRVTKQRKKAAGSMPMKKKAAIVMVLLLLLSFGTSVQAYAASGSSATSGKIEIYLEGDIYEYNPKKPYAYKLIDRVAAGSEYPSMEGFTFANGNAYVLKTNGKAGTECVLFSGKKDNLKRKGKAKSELKHGNDMTYRKKDGKLYVAPMSEDYIVRMTTSGTVETKIKANFLVGSIACWSDYDKANGKDAFILKNHWDGSFHVVEINGTTITEICKFKVEGRSNQGICVYNGYLYVTEWGSDYGNSYVYRVEKKLSTIVKEKGKPDGKNGDYIKKIIVTLDKTKLLSAAGVSGRALKVEIESIEFLNGYLYFTANANYRDATKARKQHSLDGLYMVKKQLA